MTYLIVAFAAGAVTTAAIKISAAINRIEKTDHKRSDGRELIAERAIRKQLETELAEAKRLLRVREDQRDEADDLTESMGERITYLESEVKRLKGYETAVRELNRSVEILAEDVPF